MAPLFLQRAQACSQKKTGFDETLDSLRHPKRSKDVKPCNLLKASSSLKRADIVLFTSDTWARFCSRVGGMPRFPTYSRFQIPGG